MFIPTLRTEGQGLDAERSVWEAVVRVFREQETHAVHHFPMFFANGAGRREMDILIIDKRLGVCAIEVKGLNISQIEAVQGHVWSYRNFYEKQGAPYQQTERQVDMLCGHLEREPILYNRLTKRAVVALPYITEQEWRARGFHEQINVPLPLFKEDLADIRRFASKLERYSIREASSTLSEEEMKKIARALGFRVVESEKPKLRQRLPFSRLFMIRNEGDFDYWNREIETALRNGTKVYILSYVSLNKAFLDQYEAYINEYQLNIYSANAHTSILPAGSYSDGEGISELMLDDLAADFRNFNAGQYKAIHQPADVHQIITAGAGTGKTHVMIDRILFLLINGGIPLKKITMITFTNASTNEMKKRLEEKLISLFNLTRNTQFLQYAEDVKDMQISTIHSYAQSILKELAHEIGYGRNVQLRSYNHVKKTIIHELMEGYFRTHPLEPFLNLGMKDYEFVDMVFEMWEEMEKKGLTRSEISDIDWGRPVNENAGVIQSLLAYIFEKCEELLDERKLADNAITMGDLIRKLKLFTSDDDKMRQLSKDHYLFVDEFQDSDGVQIELLASLQRYLDYRLFVVGDIKQAIYRFRGADYRSFQELIRVTQGMAAFKETELQLNYRSSKSLLEKMHPLFVRWNEHNWLKYESHDRLFSSKESQFPCNDWHVSEDYKEDLAKALRSLPDRKEKIALIVRTNRQAKEIKEHCSSQNIPTTENLDGTFFVSETVLHFKALLEGLLYPEEPKYLVNALRTPYFGCVIPYRVLIPFGGHKERMAKFIHDSTGDQIKRFARSLRTYAPMTVIQTIIRENQLFARLSDYMRQNWTQNDPNCQPSQQEIELAVLRYEKNLQHLMNLIERNFAAQQVTLTALCDWLRLQIHTNRTENEPVLDQSKAQVEITTVHRSKGLEYHTVFIPITNSRFNSVQPKFYLEENTESANQTKRKMGWCIKNEESGPLRNAHYYALKRYEDEEQFKEETRLLYVALTRAKQRLFITMPSRVKSNSWSYILKEGGLLDGLGAASR